MRGKDYCNCEHAQMFKYQVKVAARELLNKKATSALKVRLALRHLEDALDSDVEARREYLDDLRGDE